MKNRKFSFRPFKISTYLNRTQNLFLPGLAQCSVLNRMETPNQTPPSSPLPDDCYAYMNSEPVLDKDELKALLIEVVKKVVKKGEKILGKS